LSRCMSLWSGTAPPGLREMRVTIIVHNPIYTASFSALPTIDGGIISGVLYSGGRIEVRT
jgi:hypothetical protein